MTETEIKILDIDKNALVEQLNKLGAEKVLDTRLFVQWVQNPNLPTGSEAPWYMRVRADSDENVEITWKGRAIQRSEVSRTTEEINLQVGSMKEAQRLFEAIGFDLYAYQEKDRVSYIYKDWRFDIDTYPGIPTYVEIEGKGKEHLQEAIDLFNLGSHKTANRGERILIEEEYGVDWYDMRF